MDKHDPNSARNNARPAAAPSAFQANLAANKHMVLDCEDPERYIELRQQCMDRFKPADPVEARIVLRIANSLWRIWRADGLETATLDGALGTALS